VRVVDIVRRHNIVVLEAVGAGSPASALKKGAPWHAWGDGTFIVDPGA